MTHHDHEHRIQVYHATAPTCWWSWGYEALMNRLKLVYGNQIDVKTMTLAVYNDLAEYKKHYELNSMKDMTEWAKEAIDIMGVPIPTDYDGLVMPETVFPATMAAMAAYKQGDSKGARFVREILRRTVVEGDWPRDDAYFTEAAKAAGLDVSKFEKAYADEEACQAAFEKQGEAFDVHIGFYNIAITDGHGTVVTIDHAFDPEQVEGAIDWLSGGKLKKATPTDVIGYVRHHGAAPLIELSRVFGVPQEKMEKELESFEKAGKLKRTTLAGAPHWIAK
ncbi:MAG: DsbA family protein [Euryarchaeota archaeon]|nr:DsbA family protein [Euryarchaeota archaeon]